MGVKIRGGRRGNFGRHLYPSHNHYPQNSRRDGRIDLEETKSTSSESPAQAELNSTHCNSNGPERRNGFEVSEQRTSEILDQCQSTADQERYSAAIQRELDRFVRSCDDFSSSSSGLGNPDWRADEAEGTNVSDITFHHVSNQVSGLFKMDNVCDGSGKTESNLMKRILTYDYPLRGQECDASLSKDEMDKKLMNKADVSGTKSVHLRKGRIYAARRQVTVVRGNQNMGQQVGHKYFNKLAKRNHLSIYRRRMYKPNNWSSCCLKESVDVRNPGKFVSDDECGMVGRRFHDLSPEMRQSSPGKFPTKFFPEVDVTSNPGTSSGNQSIASGDVSTLPMILRKGLIGQNSDSELEDEDDAAELNNSRDRNGAIEKVEVIDGIEFLTFENEHQMVQFTRLEMEDSCKSEMTDLGYSSEFPEAILPMKTKDIKKIKGWQKKKFTITQNPITEQSAVGVEHSSIGDGSPECIVFERNCVGQQSDNDGSHFDGDRIFQRRNEARRNLFTSDFNKEETAKKTVCEFDKQISLSEWKPSEKSAFVSFLGFRTPTKPMRENKILPNEGIENVCIVPERQKSGLDEEIELVDLESDSSKTMSHTNRQPIVTLSPTSILMKKMNIEKVKVKKLVVKMNKSVQVDIAYNEVLKCLNKRVLEEEMALSRWSQSFENVWTIDEKRALFAVSAVRQSTPSRSIPQFSPKSTSNHSSHILTRKNPSLRGKYRRAVRNVFHMEQGERRLLRSSIKKADPVRRTRASISSPLRNANSLYKQQPLDACKSTCDQKYTQLTGVNLMSLFDKPPLTQTGENVEEVSSSLASPPENESHVKRSRQSLSDFDVSVSSLNGASSSFETTLTPDAGGHETSGYLEYLNPTKLPSPPLKDNQHSFSSFRGISRKARRRMISKRNWVIRRSKLMNNVSVDVSKAELNSKSVVGHPGTPEVPNGNQRSPVFWEVNHERKCPGGQGSSPEMENEDIRVFLRPKPRHHIIASSLDNSDALPLESATHDVEINNSLELSPPKNKEIEVFKSKSPRSPSCTRKKLIRELHKLNANLVSVDQNDCVPVESQCVKEFCQLGCVCDSINTDKRLVDHCGKVECMFSCTCPPSGGVLSVAKTSIASDTVTRLQEESSRHMARVERDFHNTVVETAGELVLPGRRQRERRIPKRFLDEDIIPEVLFFPKKPKPTAVISKSVQLECTPAPRKIIASKPISKSNSKSCRINVFKIPNLSSSVRCMFHSKVDCVCLKFGSNNRLPRNVALKSTTNRRQIFPSILAGSPTDCISSVQAEVSDSDGDSSKNVLIGPVNHVDDSEKLRNEGENNDSVQLTVVEESAVKSSQKLSIGNVSVREPSINKIFSSDLSGNKADECISVHSTDSDNALNEESVLDDSVSSLDDCPHSARTAGIDRWISMHYAEETDHHDDLSKDVPALPPENLNVKNDVSDLVIQDDTSPMFKIVDVKSVPSSSFDAVSSVPALKVPVPKVTDKKSFQNYDAFCAWLGSRQTRCSDFNQICHEQLLPHALNSVIVMKWRTLDTLMKNHSAHMWVRQRLGSPARIFVTTKDLPPDVACVNFHDLEAEEKLTAKVALILKASREDAYSLNGCCILLCKSGYWEVGGNINFKGQRSLLLSADVEPKRNTLGAISPSEKSDWKLETWNVGRQSESITKTGDTPKKVDLTFKVDTPPRKTDFGFKVDTPLRKVDLGFKADTPPRKVDFGFKVDTPPSPELKLSSSVTSNVMTNPADGLLESDDLQEKDIKIELGFESSVISPQPPDDLEIRPSFLTKTDQDGCVEITLNVNKASKLDRKDEKIPSIGISESPSNSALCWERIPGYLTNNRKKPGMVTKQIRIMSKTKKSSKSSKVKVPEKSTTPLKLIEMGSLVHNTELPDQILEIEEVDSTSAVKISEKVKSPVAINSSVKDGSNKIPPVDSGKANEIESGTAIAGKPGENSLSKAQQVLASSKHFGNSSPPRKPFLIIDLKKLQSSTSASQNISIPIRITNTKVLTQEIDVLKSNLDKANIPRSNQQNSVIPDKIIISNTPAHHSIVTEKVAVTSPLCSEADSLPLSNLHLKIIKGQQTTNSTGKKDNLDSKEWSAVSEKLPETVKAKSQETIRLVKSPDLSGVPHLLDKSASLQVQQGKSGKGSDKTINCDDQLPFPEEAGCISSQRRNSGGDLEADFCEILDVTSSSPSSSPSEIPPQSVEALPGKRDEDSAEPIVVCPPQKSTSPTVTEDPVPENSIATTEKSLNCQEEMDDIKEVSSDEVKGNDPLLCPDQVSILKNPPGKPIVTVPGERNKNEPISSQRKRIKCKVLKNKAAKAIRSSGNEVKSKKRFKHGALISRPRENGNVHPPGPLKTIMKKSVPKLSVFIREMGYAEKLADNHTASLKDNQHIVPEASENVIPGKEASKGGKDINIVGASIAENELETQESINSPEIDCSVTSPPENDEKSKSSVKSIASDFSEDAIAAFDNVEKCVEQKASPCSRSFENVGDDVGTNVGSQRYDRMEGRAEAVVEEDPNAESPVNNSKRGEEDKSLDDASNQMKDPESDVEEIISEPTKTTISPVPSKSPSPVEESEINEPLESEKNDRQPESTSNQSPLHSPSPVKTSIDCVPSPCTPSSTLTEGAIWTSGDNSSVSSTPVNSASDDQLIENDVIWYRLILNGEFDKLTVEEAGFSVSSSKLSSAVQIAKNTKRTVRLSFDKNAKNSDSHHFKKGIYAVPTVTGKYVRIGPYKPNEPTGVKTYKKIEAHTYRLIPNLLKVELGNAATIEMLNFSAEGRNASEGCMDKNASMGDSCDKNQKTPKPNVVWSWNTRVEAIPGIFNSEVDKTAGKSITTPNQVAAKQSGKKRWSANVSTLKSSQDNSSEVEDRQESNSGSPKISDHGKEAFPISVSLKGTGRSDVKSSHSTMGSGAARSGVDKSHRKQVLESNTKSNGPSRINPTKSTAAATVPKKNFSALSKPQRFILPKHPIVRDYYLNSDQARNKMEMSNNIYKLGNFNANSFPPSVLVLNGASNKHIITSKPIVRERAILPDTSAVINSTDESSIESSASSNSSEVSGGRDAENDYNDAGHPRRKDADVQVDTLEEKTNIPSQDDASNIWVTTVTNNSGKRVKFVKAINDHQSVGPSRPSPATIRSISDKKSLPGNANADKLPSDKSAVNNSTATAEECQVLPAKDTVADVPQKGVVILASGNPKTDSANVPAGGPRNVVPWFEISGEGPMALEGTSDCGYLIPDIPNLAPIKAKKSISTGFSVVIEDPIRDGVYLIFRDVKSVNEYVNAAIVKHVKFFPSNIRIEWTFFKHNLLALVPGLMEIKDLTSDMFMTPTGVFYYKDFNCLDDMKNIGLDKSDQFSLLNHKVLKDIDEAKLQLLSLLVPKSSIPGIPIGVAVEKALDEIIFLRRHSSLLNQSKLNETVKQMHLDRKLKELMEAIEARNALKAKVGPRRGPKKLVEGRPMNRVGPRKPKRSVANRVDPGATDAEKSSTNAKESNPSVDRENLGSHKEKKSNKEYLRQRRVLRSSKIIHPVKKASPADKRPRPEMTPPPSTSGALGTVDSKRPPEKEILKKILSSSPNSIKSIILNSNFSVGSDKSKTNGCDDSDLATNVSLDYEPSQDEHNSSNGKSDRPVNALLWKKSFSQQKVNAILAKGSSVRSLNKLSNARKSFSKKS